MNTKDSKYKDVHAIEITTGSLTALFLPLYGAKLASLKDTKTGREFLEQAAGKTYKKLDYAEDYVAAECSAFDDMFPTCDKYRCNQFPWQGAELPDHGEVCGLPWQYEAGAESVHMWVYSPRFGYKLEKWIRTEAGKLVIDYRATNNTRFEFDFLYGAHCMIAAEEGAVIETEFGAGSEAALIFDNTGKRGRYCGPFVWNADSGVTPDRNDKSNYKIFFDAPAKEGWCSYTYKDGSRLRFCYSPDKLPYLGIWFNWGDLKGMYNFAFEPCSGSYDRPDLARMHNQYSTLAPHGIYEWSISFEVEK
jgi:galactose mutarotase-like enzyme